MEGRKEEPRLLQRVFEEFGLADEREIVSFEANVHMLLNHLEAAYGGPGGVDYESLDIKGVLKDMLSTRATSLVGGEGR